MCHPVKGRLPATESPTGMGPALVLLLSLVAVGIYNITVPGHTLMSLDFHRGRRGFPDGKVGAESWGPIPVIHPVRVRQDPKPSLGTSPP